MRPVRRWDFFHWMTFLRLGCVALFVAAVADIALGQGWGLGWTELWGALGLFVLGAPLSLLVMAVQGLFDRPEDEASEN